MSLRDDLSADIRTILATRWSTRAGLVVPEPETVLLGNDSVELDATVLYADLADSTTLVDSSPPWLAAEVYKSFLRCSSRLIRAEGGTITAFDGDRVMGVFVGSRKNTSAARCALKINFAVSTLIVPAFRTTYALPSFTLAHAVGIDTGSILVARTGIRGSNDLVWVGPAANYAAKLSGIRDSGYSSYITTAVFDALHESVQQYEGAPIWEPRIWKTTNRSIRQSNWWWRVD